MDEGDVLMRPRSYASLYPWTSRFLLHHLIWGVRRNRDIEWKSRSRRRRRRRRRRGRRRRRRRIRGVWRVFGSRRRRVVCRPQGCNCHRPDLTWNWPLSLLYHPYRCEVNVQFWSKEEDTIILLTNEVRVMGWVGRQENVDEQKFVE
jgi:hypothetical protein